jgi:hypothetical protein
LKSAIGFIEVISLISASGGLSSLSIFKRVALFSASIFSSFFSSYSMTSFQ